jgi:hypothetical protein
VFHLLDRGFISFVESPLFGSLWADESCLSEEFEEHRGGQLAKPSFSATMLRADTVINSIAVHLRGIPQSDSSAIRGPVGAYHGEIGALLSVCGEWARTAL